MAKRTKKKRPKSAPGEAAVLRLTAGPGELTVRPGRREQGLDLKLRGFEEAPEETRIALFRHLATLVRQTKDSELSRGRDRAGARLKKVQRKWGGPPLTPANETSRFRRYLRTSSDANGVTLYWGYGWGVIVGYHANQRGPRTLPVRDVVGFSQNALNRLRASARGWWKEHGTTTPPAAPAPTETKQAPPGETILPPTVEELMPPQNPVWFPLPAPPNEATPEATEQPGRRGIFRRIWDLFTRWL